MKRALMVGLILALVSFVGAQTTVPGGGGGSSSITSGTTATSGCLDGAPLKSASDVVTCTKMDLTKFVTADQADTAGAFVNVTDLGFSVAANTNYVFQCQFLTISAAGSTAVQIAFNGPASPTSFAYTGIAAVAVNSFVTPAGTAYDSTTGLGITASAIQTTPQTFFGTLENGANAGTFIPRLRTEVAASAATIQRGSWCRVWTP